MRPIDLAYAAGVIDSDGWFTCGFSKGTRKTGTTFAHWYFRCAFKQVDTEAINFFHEKFGGNVTYRIDKSNRFGKKPLYTWSVTGRPMLEFAKHIIPYLKIKRNRAQLILDYYKGYKIINGLPHSQRQREHDRRSRIREKLKKLNHH